MKVILTMGVLIVMSAGGFAQTLQTPDDPQEPPVATRDAANEPVEGTELTEDRARSRMEEMGYGNVADLERGDDGFWRGTAEKAGASVVVTLDDQGNATEGVE